jgi:hypothetical protein
MIEKRLYLFNFVLLRGLGAKYTATLIQNINADNRNKYIKLAVFPLQLQTKGRPICPLPPLLLPPCFHPWCLC